MVSARLLPPQELFGGFCRFVSRQFFCNSVSFVSIPMVFNLFSRALAGVPRAATTKRTTVAFVFHIFISSLARFRYFSIFSTSLWSTLVPYGIAKSIIWHSWCFLSIKIMSDFLAVIKWSVYRILRESFWLILIPFWFNIDSIRSTNFPMNTSSDPIMTYFILFLSKFGTFTYNVVISLISPNTHYAFRLFLGFINLPFSYINSNGLFLSSTYQGLASYFATIATSRDSPLP